MIKNYSLIITHTHDPRLVPTTIRQTLFSVIPLSAPTVI